jgi:hypothetical protein
MKKAKVILIVVLLVALAVWATSPTFYAGRFENTGEIYWGVAWTSGGLANGRIYLCPTAGYFDNDAGVWVDGPDNPLAPVFPDLVVDC